MNKEQLIAIIQSGHHTDGDLADALLAELAKQSEPVGYQRRIKYGQSPGSVSQWVSCLPDEATDPFRRSPNHEYRKIYTQPQPDLVAEIERLKADNSKLQNAYNIRDDEITGFIGIEKELRQQLNEQEAEIEKLKEQYVSLQLAQASKVAELRQQLSEAQSRIELLEHDAKTGDYETLYAQTVVELSAAQVSEDALLKALETFFECRGSDSYSCGLLSNEGLALIATHKARKEVE